MQCKCYLNWDGIDKIFKRIFTKAILIQGFNNIYNRNLNIYIYKKQLNALSIFMLNFIENLVF